MRPHVFVAMPFGLKGGVDFDAVYRDFIRPAVELGGFEVFRADEETRAGDIKTDMFQELLLADLVIADLTVDNPNVWYELGVRHALRARGVVLVQSPRDYQPFDVYTDRKLHYHLKDGVPDPNHLQADVKALAAMLASTAGSWHGHKASPVYHLLRGLSEPDWRTLLLSERNEQRDAYETWLQRIEVARKENRPGDVLLLAEETPTYALRLEAKRSAGRALLRLRQHELALEQFDAALALNPDDVLSRQQKGICLRRLARNAEAEQWIRDLVTDHPGDPECLSLSGRIAKEEWQQRWQVTTSASSTVALARRFRPLLHDAIDCYRTAFSADARHYYSGVNAATLSTLAQHVGAPLLSDDERGVLQGAALWACSANLARDHHDNWARASLAELQLISGRGDAYLETCQHAAVGAAGDWFALDSIRQTLSMFGALRFMLDRVEPALALIEEELGRAVPPPRQVLLFSGHMIDRPDRPSPRFPADREPLVAEAISAKLDEIDAGPGDVGISGAACGADLLFVEQALARGVRLQILIPFAEPRYLRESVSYAGEGWSRRFFAARDSEQAHTRVLERELGAGPRDVDPHSRNGLWQLLTALAMGPDRVRFIHFWDGREGDGPGGVESTLKTVEQYLGRTYRIDPHRIFQGHRP